MSLWRRLLGIDASPTGADRSPAESTQDEGQRVDNKEEAGVSTLPATRLTDEQLLAAARGAAERGEVQRALDLLAARLSSLHGGAMSVSPELELEYASLLVSRGREEAALEVLHGMTKNPKVRQTAWARIGELAEGQGRTREAANACERILARSVRAPGVQERLARLTEDDASRTHEGVTIFAASAPLPRRFRVIRQVGVGGAGTVYHATEGPTGRAIALKLYHRQGASNRDRLLREARMASALDTHGVVRVFDADPTRGFLTMEWLPQGSLRNAMAASPVPLEVAHRWVRSALKVIDTIHQLGVVHRDLKPSNFLLRDDGDVVVTDFGLALRVGELGAGSKEGTVGYMAPEQADQPAAPAQDVFAFGACLRTLAFSVRAGAESEGELLELSGFADVITSWLAISERCMSRDAAERPSTRWLLSQLGAEATNAMSNR